MLCVDGGLWHPTSPMVGKQRLEAIQQEAQELSYLSTSDILTNVGMHLLPRSVRNDSDTE
jgi:hypothetical protein